MDLLAFESTASQAWLALGRKPLLVLLGLQQLEWGIQQGRSGWLQVPRQTLDLCLQPLSLGSPLSPKPRSAQKCWRVRAFMSWAWGNDGDAIPCIALVILYPMKVRRPRGFTSPWNVHFLGEQCSRRRKMQRWFFPFISDVCKRTPSPLWLDYAKVIGVLPLHFVSVGFAPLTLRRASSLCIFSFRLLGFKLESFDPFFFFFLFSFKIGTPAWRICWIKGRWYNRFYSGKWRWPCVLIRIGVALASFAEPIFKRHRVRKGAAEIAKSFIHSIIFRLKWMMKPCAVSPSRHISTDAKPYIARTWESRLLNGFRAFHMDKPVLHHENYAWDLGRATACSSWAGVRLESVSPPSLISVFIFKNDMSLKMFTQCKVYRNAAWFHQTLHERGNFFLVQLKVSVSVFVDTPMETPISDVYLFFM